MSDSSHLGYKKKIPSKIRSTPSQDPVLVFLLLSRTNLNKQKGKVARCQTGIGSLQYRHGAGILKVVSVQPLYMTRQS